MLIADSILYRRIATPYDVSKYKIRRDSAHQFINEPCGSRIRSAGKMKLYLRWWAEYWDGSVSIEDFSQAGREAAFPTISSVRHCKHNGQIIFYKVYLTLVL